MKHYHSIEKNVEDYIGQHVYGFRKFDGSNFCAEWNKKLSKKSRFTNGFGKFGTRTQMIKNANNPFEEAIGIFENKYAEKLDKIFNEEKIFRGIDTITVYGEFFGADSLAERWARENRIELLVFLPDWEQFGKSAGYKRNIQIIESADAVIAFWDGQSKGTQHSINLAKDKGKPLAVINYK